MNFKLNDDMFVFYLVVMFLCIVSANLFFVTRASQMSFIALTYLVLSIAFKPKISRMDLSKNIITYFFYAVISSLIFFFFIDGSSQSSVQFTNVFTKFVYVIFVIAFSESIIRRGLLEKIQNSFITNGIMALGHSYAYMNLSGSFTFSSEVLSMLAVAFVGFFIFELVYKFSKDTFVEALVHGLYNMRFY